VSDLRCFQNQKEATMKVCTCCHRSYSLPQYFDLQPPRSSGKGETIDGTFLQVWRDCPCGNTMMIEKDLSVEGSEFEG